MIDPGPSHSLGAWRRGERARLIARRMAMDEAAHAAASDAITEAFLARFDPATLGLVGGYWPIRREYDCRALLRRVVDAGGETALPMTPGPRDPLQFRPWTPDTEMATGRWDIPHPAAGAAVRPEVLLIPLVGFDARGYRLGYGGGFYDRTLAAPPQRPLTVGLGFEIGRLPSIRPGPHDIPMDVIITEAGVVRDAAPR